MAHVLQDLGEANILAVVHDLNLNTGVGAISVINNYYGRNHIPLGKYTGPVGAGGGHPWWTHGGRGVFVDDLVEKFSPPIRSYNDHHTARRARGSR